MSRNWLTSWYMKHDQARVLWLDDDVFVRPTDLWELIRTAWEHDLDILGGVYPLKRDGAGKMAAAWDWDQVDSVTLGAGGGITPVKWLGGGCLVIHRRVFIGLGKAFRERGDRLLTFDIRDGERMQGFRWWRNCEMRHGAEWTEGGEDVGFFSAVREHGFRPFADTRFRVLHEGPHLFDFGDALVPKPPRHSIVLERPNDWDKPKRIEDSPCTT